MQYLGIKYEIKIAPGPNEWVWEVHIPKPRTGSVKGARERAVLAAEIVIRKYCREHPGECSAC
jgi:hypothetical protein